MATNPKNPFASIEDEVGYWKFPMGWHTDFLIWQEQQKQRRKRGRDNTPRPNPPGKSRQRAKYVT